MSEKGREEVQVTQLHGVTACGTATGFSGFLANRAIVINLFDVRLYELYGHRLRAYEFISEINSCL